MTIKKRNHDWHTLISLARKLKIFSIFFYDGCLVTKLVYVCFKAYFRMMKKRWFFLGKNISNCIENWFKKSIKNSKKQSTNRKMEQKSHYGFEELSFINFSTSYFLIEIKSNLFFRFSTFFISFSDKQKLFCSIHQNKCYLIKWMEQNHYWHFSEVI